MTQQVCLLLLRPLFKNNFELYSLFLHNGVIPFHLIEQFSLAIGSAVLLTNIPNPAIDPKKEPRGFRRRSKSREETPNRCSGGELPLIPYSKSKSPAS